MTVRIYKSDNLFLLPAISLNLNVWYFGYRSLDIYFLKYMVEFRFKRKYYDDEQL